MYSLLPLLMGTIDGTRVNLSVVGPKLWKYHKMPQSPLESYQRIINKQLEDNSFIITILGGDHWWKIVILSVVWL
jgi:hypothetical protein